MPSPEVIAAHQHSSHHRQELPTSDSCGCFYCLSTFPPTAITVWIDEGDGTALCPHCGIDAVIGSASGYPMTPTFWQAMHAYWFGHD